MRNAIAVAAVLVLVVGCNKDKPTTGATPSATAAASAKTASAPSAMASAAPSAAPSAAASGAVTEEAEDQEGLEKGEVIVGYLQDLKDEGQCAALPAPAAEKSKYDAKKLEEVATTMKAKVVPKCPTDNAQGTCKMMGMLVNYFGPKYTPQTAQAHCKKNRGKWFD